MKVVVNRCYGGFCVSIAVYEELGLKWDGYGFLTGCDKLGEDEPSIRSNPKLIAAIEKVGLEAASKGTYACLEIVEIPDDIDWYIADYDGIETVHEQHRSW